MSYDRAFEQTNIDFYFIYVDVYCTSLETQSCPEFSSYSRRLPAPGRFHRETEFFL